MASSALNKLVGAAMVTGAAALLAYHAAMEFATLRLAEPMGYPEVVYRGVSEVWPHQYQYGHFVDTQDNYGPGFSAFCRPFLAMGLDPYVAARVANFAAIAAAAVLLVWILRANRISRAVTMAVVAVFFALNAGSSSIQARPDFLETLLIIACLGVGRPGFLGRLNAVLAGAVVGAAGLAAFLTKPYGLLAWAVVASYPFVAPRAERRTRRSVTIAGVSALVIALGVTAFARANPYFLTETVLFHVAHTDPGLGVFLVQARDFAILGCGLVGVVVVSLVLGAKDGPAVAWPGDSERRYWVWALALGFGAIVGGLGWHRGAYLTYYHHLILPPLAVVAAFSAEGVPGAVAGCALIANCAVLMMLAPRFPGRDPGWDSLAADVSAQRGPIVVDYWLDPLVHGRGDARTAGNGINRFALDEPDLIGGNSRIMRAARLEVRAYVDNERALIRKGPEPRAIYMDCILFPGRPDDTRVPAHGFVAIPRNDHPLLLNGYDMSRYAPQRLFVIHPFYGSQNSPRQDAGTWTVTIVKFVRDPVGTGRLPIVLVPPAN